MIPPSTTITEEGRRNRRTWLRLLALLVVVNLVVWGASLLSSGGAVAGPDGSSYVTTRAGTAAAAGTLRRLGFKVEQSRVPLDEARLEPGGTVVVMDVDGASYSAAELNRLESFVTGGGTLVIGGRASFAGSLLEEASQWQSAGSAVGRPVGSILDTAGFDSVPLSGFGSFQVSTADTPILVGDGDVTVGVARSMGDGIVFWLADSHPFHNEGIGVDDSAVMLVSLVSDGGPVVFDEYRHGFRDDAGLLAVLPPRAKVTLLLLGVVGLLGLVAYGRRFGVPHDVTRRLPPGREAYLEAVAGILTRSNSTGDALDVIRGAARETLAERAPAGTDPARAAELAGLDAAAARAVLGDTDDHETLLAADRALATLNRETP